MAGGVFIILTLLHINAKRGILFTFSALEGVCHQAGTENAFDIGSPTYFRKSISTDGGTGRKNVFHL